ncbi:MAG: AAA family ATPase [Clostridia bacterium]|nr:AAA family ATPase [Clostridia bacterium]
MKLLELYIREFGALKEKKITLCEGINLFEGENETGKSTVMLFIQFMLYGLPRRGHPAREKAISRSGHVAAGSMRLSFEGEDYRIERSYVETGRGSEKLTVYRLRDGEKVFAGEEPGQVFLKVPREIFENSCSIGQTQCAGLGGEKGAAAIRNLLSSADETVDMKKVTKKLEDIRVRYCHKTGKGGRLYEMNEEINSCRLRLEKATENHLRIAELAEKISGNTLRMEQTERELKDAELLVNEMNRVEVLRRFDAMRTNEKELLAAQEKRKTLWAEQLETEYRPTEVDVANLNALSDSLGRAERELADAERQMALVLENARYEEAEATVGESLGQLGGVQTVTKQLTRSRRGRAILGVAAILFGLGAVAAVLLLEGMMRFWVGIGMLSLATVTLAVSVALGATGKTLAARYGKTPAELSAYLLACEAAYSAKRETAVLMAAATAKRDTAKGHEIHLRQKLASALGKTKRTVSPTVAEAKNEAKRLGEFLVADRTILQRIETLSRLVDNDQQILSVHREEELRQSITVNPGEITEETMAKAVRVKALCADKLRMLRQNDKQLREEWINRKASSEDPLAIADRQEYLREELRVCEEYYEAVQTAIEGLQAASDAMSGNITPAICRTAGKMMDYISDGRYAEMKMGNAMTVSLSDVQERITSGEMLSGGTKDAAYITLRLALMMQIFGGELPPLMMDEALCQVDDRRVERILSLLGKLAREGLQCLIFTCHRREAEACLTLGIPVTRISLKNVGND